MLKRFVALGALALSVAAGSVATADQTATPSPGAVPSPPPVPTIPPSVKLDPYGRYAIDVLGNIIRQGVLNLTPATSGRVTYFRRFDMQVQSSANTYREIHLHQGTVINPRGATITPGQHVEVSGAPQSDGSLDANVITIDQ
jgi:hypothetical protein